VFDPARFPTAARVGPAAGAAYQAAYDPEHAFAFGLERILDGGRGAGAVAARGCDPLGRLRRFAEDLTPSVS
jgi:hypothetical protein